MDEWFRKRGFVEKPVFSRSLMVAGPATARTTDSPTAAAVGP